LFIKLKRNLVPKKLAPKKIKQEWTAWEDISPYMPIAVVAEEDQNFPYHFGFDFQSISKVISAKSWRLRGARTLTDSQ